MHGARTCGVVQQRAQGSSSGSTSTRTSSGATTTSTTRSATTTSSRTSTSTGTHSTSTTASSSTTTSTTSSTTSSRYLLQQEPQKQGPRQSVFQLRIRLLVGGPAQEEVAHLCGGLEGGGGVG